MVSWDGVHKMNIYHMIIMWSNLHELYCVACLWVWAHDSHMVWVGLWLLCAQHMIRGCYQLSAWVTVPLWISPCPLFFFSLSLSLPCSHFLLLTISPSLSHCLVVFLAWRHGAEGSWHHHAGVSVGFLEGPHHHRSAGQFLQFLLTSILLLGVMVLFSCLFRGCWH